MPIYEWTCSACGKDFESLSKPYEPVACPHCKAEGEHKKLVPSKITYQINAYSNPASTSPKRQRVLDEALKSGPLGSDNEGIF